MLRLAALRLGVAPAAFWGLSLREWRALTATNRGEAGPLGRASFDALLADHPDDIP
ncbi:hypothetical protein BH09PSE2_BH09PSE2_03470 [soil metagenome]